jgi:hypothetical protein
LLRLFFRHQEGSMSRGKFVVAFEEGHWRIGYNERWYGEYPDRASAQGATLAIVQAHGEVPTRIIVREMDGTEELVWPHSRGKALSRH